MNLMNDSSVHCRFTVKHDGMCSKITQTEDGVRVFRRYDVRKGNSPPVGAIPARAIPSDDDSSPSPPPEFFWIDVTDSVSAGDQYYLSAFEKVGNKIQSLTLVTPNSENTGIFIPFPVPMALPPLSPAEYRLRLWY
eukprot:TRINITY_DN6305_c0_g1_i5.p1 TRINITY_DN6305_c0_g1~~TRINITY_DN6305_c0_g1_i5.p1  ORF type:complete len:136 (-),score=9.83 TRINITY_DN6305_c0_g1_i5:484-891(-)